MGGGENLPAPSDVRRYSVASSKVCVCHKASMHLPLLNPISINCIWHYEFISWNIYSEYFIRKQNPLKFNQIQLQENLAVFNISPKNNKSNNEITLIRNIKYKMVFLDIKWLFKNFNPNLYFYHVINQQFKTNSWCWNGYIHTASTCASLTGLEAEDPVAGTGWPAVVLRGALLVLGVPDGPAVAPSLLVVFTLDMWSCRIKYHFII